MPFPDSHLYLTLHWQNIQFTTEHGQCGIRFDSPNRANQTRVDALQTAATTLWGAIGNDYRLEYLRLARIGTGGHYSNASSYDHPMGNVGSSTASVYPMQIACVSTLTTGVPHGDASKGRIYLPPIPGALGGDYFWTAAQVNARSAAVATFLQSAAAVLGGPAAVFSKGTARNPGGVKRRISGVMTGRRPDVQRRRAKGILEVYGLESTVNDVPRDAGAAQDDVVPNLP